MLVLNDFEILEIVDDNEDNLESYFINQWIFFEIQYLQVASLGLPKLLLSIQKFLFQIHMYYLIMRSIFDLLTTNRRMAWFSTLIN